jgi:hypothetical protein
MKTGLKNMTTELPKWAKGVIAVAIVGGVGFILYKIYKGLQKKQDEKNQKEVVKNAEDEVKKLSQQGMKLSNSESVYSSTANYIQNMLDGCETATTELAVIQKIMICVQNKLDWAKLISVFGSRKIDNCGLGTGDTIYDLPSLLSEQLDSVLVVYSVSNGKGYSDTGATNRSISILRKYLLTKGITI